MLQRNLLYTGVTRGRRLVVLVGQRKALAVAVKGSRARRRWSKLREWLIGSARPNAAVLMHQIDGSAGSRQLPGSTVTLSPTVLRLVVLSIQRAIGPDSS